MTARKYYKTGIITAEQFDGSQRMIDKYHLQDKRSQWPQLVIHTLEGDMDVDNDDWIATGVEDEHWPITDDIFRNTYAPLPAVPKTVLDTIEAFKSADWRLDKVFEECKTRWQDFDDSTSRWIISHADVFATAWLAWPNMEVSDE